MDIRNLTLQASLWRRRRRRRRVVVVAGVFVSFLRFCCSYVVYM